MYKLLPILLFAFSIAQVDLDTFIKDHPNTIKNQKFYKDLFLYSYCNDNETLIDNSTINLLSEQASLLPEFISINFNSILNSDNYFIEIDSIGMPG